MELKLQAKIFYPSHGAGWVKTKKVIEFGGQQKEYYEFQFINNPLTISTPVENVEKLGVREVLSEKAILKKLEELKKKKQEKPKFKDFNELILILNQLEREGSLDAYIKIIQYSNYIRVERDKEGRLIPVTIDKHIKNSIDNIVAELAVSNETDIPRALDKFHKVTDTPRHGSHSED